jgi:hypothetical protein
MYVKTGLRSLLALFLLLLVGCEKSDVRTTSELDESRILALSIVPHELNLNAVPDTLDIEVLDYVLTGDAVYNWMVCPSVGAIGRYECLDDAPTLEGVSNTPNWSLPFDLSGLSATSEFALNTDFSDWQPNPCPNHEVIACNDQTECPLGSFCIEAVCRSVTELYPIELVVKVQPVYDGIPGISAAMSLPLLAGTSTNQRIRLTSLDIDGVALAPREDDCSVTSTIGSDEVEIELSAMVNPASLDEFQVSTASGCDSSTEATVGTVSWYATEGEFKKPLSDLEEPTNSLRLEAGTESVKLYVVARDGRGTLDGRCITLLRE